MERVFYPFSKRFFRQKYIRPAMFFLFFGFIFGIANVFRGAWPASFILVVALGGWVLSVVITTLTEGFQGEMLAIKIGPTSIYGPMKVGRDMPIPFDEIDYEKTRKQKRICSFRGDQIKFAEALFDPDDVKEIWKAIDEFEQKRRKR
jgi:hypothetical protein